MSEAQSMHVSDERLQRFADGELEAADRRVAGAHIDRCAECQARLQAIAIADQAYLEFRDSVRSQDPAPPHPWPDLTARLEEIDARHARARGPRRLAWMGAAAAAVLVGVTLYSWMSRPAAVSAAELLRKAEAAEPAPSPSRRIVVRSKGRRLVRPAALAAGKADTSAPDLEALFLSARFSWQDPLSARSFNAWREQLPRKTDQVTVSAANYEIRTTTSTGPLQEAVLFLDSHDLHPLRETLRFAADEVEISELSQTDPTPAVEPPSPARRASPPPAPAAGPALELRVVAALHRVNADLGEPLQIVRRNGALAVEGTGLTPAREHEIRQALASIPGVEVSFHAAETGPLGPGPADRQTARGVRTQLETALGEEAANRILDASEAVMARAYALRGLSRRFPPEAEAQLADADRNVLAGIRSEHVSEIAAHLNTLKASFQALLPPAPRGAAPERAATWQADAERLFAAAQRLDRLINRALAGSEELRQLSPELAGALRDLTAEVER